MLTFDALYVSTSASVGHWKTSEAMRTALGLGGVFSGVGAGKQILPDQALCECEARCCEQLSAL